jgi:nicotinamide-nucleotide amidase
MWETALATAPLRELLAGTEPLEQRIVRITGIPESEIARSLREMQTAGVPMERLEITTCLRRGEIEISTVFAPDAETDYGAFERALIEQHGERIFSRDGRTIDEIVAGLLLGPPVRTVAVAESCTGGLMAGRLTDRAGSSAYVLGGITAYSNDAKIRLAGVPEELITRHGAVSPEVAAALADGARERFGADVGIGITGVAGPGGGTEEKPVGTVCFSVAGAAAREDRTVRLPGDRAAVRDRSTTVALHLLRRLLLRHA